jgi:hypothetical protein
MVSMYTVLALDSRNHVVCVVALSAVAFTPLAIAGC